MFELTGEVPNGNVVLFYAGEFGYFMSNFSAFRVTYDGEDWMTSEHAYQAAKFHRHGVVFPQILHAKSAHLALTIAHQNKVHYMPGWPTQKVRIMTEIVRAKFEQHEYIQRKLKETGDAWLIENATKDAFWGRGSDWQGRNELGKIWMRLRKEQYST